jgi:hypothetical protein
VYRNENKVTVPLLIRTSSLSPVYVNLVSRLRDENNGNTSVPDEPGVSEAIFEPKSVKSSYSR